MQNLFEILGLSASFETNEKELEKAYFTALRTCHPDRFVGKAEAERIAAITMSQAVNDAYEILKNPLTRAAHLLELNGRAVLTDGYPVPKALLLEMHDLREQVSEAAEGKVLSDLVERIKAQAATTTKRIAEAFAMQDYHAASEETLRLHYLGKAMEEAYMMVHQLKAAHE